MHSYGHTLLSDTPLLLLYLVALAMMECRWLKPIPRLSLTPEIQCVRERGVSEKRVDPPKDSYNKSRFHELTDLRYENHYQKRVGEPAENSVCCTSYGIRSVTQ